MHYFYGEPDNGNLTCFTQHLKDCCDIFLETQYI